MLLLRWFVLLEATNIEILHGSEEPDEVETMAAVDFAVSLSEWFLFGSAIVAVAVEEVDDGAPFAAVGA